MIDKVNDFARSSPMPFALPAFANTSARRAGAAGFCGFLFGVGLGRFGYPPLIPAMVAEGWASPEAARAAAAAILQGYLVGAVVGAVVAAPLARWFGAWRVLYGAGLLCVIAHSTSIVDLPELVFAGLRASAGFAGGLVTIAVPSLVAAMTEPAERARANGVAFAGLGTGLVLSGTVVPALAAISAQAAWIGLKVIVGAAAIGAILFGKDRPAPARIPGAGAAWWRRPGYSGFFALYVLVGLGNIPHTVLFVDHIARTLGLGLGLVAGGAAWVAAGFSAIAGPLLSGALVTRVGLAAAIRLTTAVMAIAAIVPAFTDAFPLLAFSGMALIGVLMGFGAVAAGRVMEIVRPADQPAAWSAMTVATGLAQAMGASLFASWTAFGLDPHAMFLTAGAIMTLALAAEWTLRPRG